MASCPESGDDISGTVIVRVSWQDRLLLPTTIAIWGHPLPTSQREWHVTRNPRMSVGGGSLVNHTHMALMLLLPIETPTSLSPGAQSQ